MYVCRATTFGYCSLAEGEMEMRSLGLSISLLAGARFLPTPIDKGAREEGEGGGKRLPASGMGLPGGGEG